MRLLLFLVIGSLALSLCGGHACGAQAGDAEKIGDAATVCMEPDAANGAEKKAEEAENAEKIGDAATVRTEPDAANGAQEKADEAGDAANEVQEKADEKAGALVDMGEIEKLLGLDEIDRRLMDGSAGEEFSFSEAVGKLVRGELPFDLDQLPQYISGLFLSELRQQKQMALQILVIVLASAVFSNFIRVFDSSQIADISFYMVYLLISGLLIHSFMAMNQIVVNTCGNVNSFMKVLLPSYLLTVVLCSGSVSALGFYEVTLLGINITQTVVVRAVLPVINFYLILLILNQMSEEDYFSRFAGLLETVISWSLKTVTGLIVGLQAVQCLVAPSVDSLKNTAARRLAKAIPGLGNILDSAAETVTASALVIKNAVGVAGILALVFICCLPVVKLAVCILIFRFLCAVIQPVSEKRMVEGIESISRGAVLLLKILVMSVSVFIISIAMVTSAIKGG